MQDILLDKDGDVAEIELTADNSLGVTQLVEQDKRSVITSYTGDYINHPDIGLNAIDFLHETSADNTFCREVNKQFTAIGMRVKAVTLQNGELTIDANYEN